MGDKLRFRPDLPPEMESLLRLLAKATPAEQRLPSEHEAAWARILRRILDAEAWESA